MQAAEEKYLISEICRKNYDMYYSFIVISYAIRVRVRVRIKHTCSMCVNVYTDVEVITVNEQSTNFDSSKYA